MNVCPLCGSDNTPGSRFCNSCGNLLDPAGTTDPQAGRPQQGGRQGSASGDDMLGQLRALSGGAQSDSDDDMFPDVDVPDWLAELSRQGDEVELPTILGARLAPPEQQPPGPSNKKVEETSSLPDWLRGAAVESGPADEVAWATDIDFSDLPAWLQSEEASGLPAPGPNDATVPDWVRQGLAEAGAGTRPAPPSEGEGSGLLSGVAGPIPVEPVIALPHKAPRFPGFSEVVVAGPVADEEAISLFSAIATGIRAAPALPAEGRSHRPLPMIFPLLLLVAVISSFFAPPFAAPPPGLTAPAILASTIEALPSQSPVLVAFDYEGSRLDELEPGVLMVLRQLASKDAHVVAISTTPFGPALAQRAWRSVSKEPGWQSPTYGERFVNLGFLPGSEAGLRTLLAASFTADALQSQRDVISGQPLATLPAMRNLESLSDIQLIVIVAAESRDVQLWVEQIGTYYPTLPLVAVVPAGLEPVLIPYVASGQVRSLLAGIVPAAGYEQQRSSGYGATRRLNGMLAAAVVFMVVVLVANIMALLRRSRRQEGS